MGVFAAVLLLGALGAFRATARQPCRPHLENLDLTLAELRVDGVRVAELDGGWPTTVASPEPVFLTPDDATLAVPCGERVSRTFGMTVTDPFTGDAELLTFEAAP